MTPHPYLLLTPIVLCWTLLLCCQPNLAVHKSSTPASLSTPEYRVAPTLNVHINPPTSFKIVRGFEARVQRFLDKASSSLLLKYGFRLKGIYGAQSEHQLSLDIDTEVSTEEALTSHYGTLKVPISMTLSDLTTTDSTHIVGQITNGVLTQLGVPASCLSPHTSKSDLKLMRRFVETHLKRTGESVALRRAALGVIAKELLAITPEDPDQVSCLQSVSAQGHRQLWIDLSSKLPKKDADNESVAPFLLQAEAALRANEPQKAYALCADRAESAPQSGAARCAATAAQLQKKFKEAVRMWRAHLSFHPSDQPATLSLARCIGRGGDDDGARAVLALALLKSPKWVDGLVEYGIALYRLNKVTKARHQWRMALETDPKNEDAAKLLKSY